MTMNRKTLFTLLTLLLARRWHCSRCPRRPRCVCSPASPSGAHWRRSWAASW
jgi:hypothetical protein